MSDTTFTGQVTVIPVDWANDVNDLVYDVFNAAKTAAAARAALGLGSLALQEANAVAVTGGVINGTSLGAVVPSSGVFTTLRASGAPTISTDAVTLGYLNTRLGSYSSMATMNPASVVLTGGTTSGLVMTGGSLNGTPIGASSPSTGRFTTLEVSTAIPVASGGTGSNAFVNKYVTYVATPSPHLESVATIPLADVLGAGTLASQNANNVNLTGGVINGVTLGGSVVYSGLGSLAQQNANNINVTGGTLENVTLVGVRYAYGLQSITAATLADSTKDVFICTANTADYIVDLPNPALVDRPMFFKKLGSFRVDLRAPSGVFIDGAGIHNLFVDKETAILISDGTNYQVF